MPYITNVERIATEKGLQQGLQQGALDEGRELIIEALAERFGNVPALVSDAVHQIQDRDRLRTLHRQAIRSASLEEFHRRLNGN